MFYNFDCQPNLIMASKTQKEAVDDPLWKSVLEQTFEYFLTFFFPEAAEVFDFSRKFIYLDKELATMFPPQPHNKGVRYVDKLVRVALCGGGEKYVLIHVETQSHRGKGDLALRMLEYYMRIISKYKVPVTAVAILADNEGGYHPQVYKISFMGTSLRYKFNSYKILDQDEAALRANPNPFAVVVLTALLAIQHADASDDRLLDIKHDLYGQMMQRNMDKKARRAIYDFLAYYVGFEKPEMLRNFENQIQQKQGRNNPVGTREYLLDKAKREGIELGVELGVEKGAEQKSYEFVSNLILETDFDDNKIAALTMVSIEFVRTIRANLRRKE